MGLHAFTAKGLGSIHGWRTSFPQAALRGQGKGKKKKKRFLRSVTSPSASLLGLFPGLPVPGPPPPEQTAHSWGRWPLAYWPQRLRVDCHPFPSARPTSHSPGSTAMAGRLWGPPAHPPPLYRGHGWPEGKVTCRAGLGPELDEDKLGGPSALTPVPTHAQRPLTPNSSSSQGRC